MKTILTLFTCVVLVSLVESLTDDELQQLINYDPMSSSPSSLVDSTHWTNSDRLKFHRLRVCRETYPLSGALSSVSVQLKHHSFYNDSDCVPFGILTLTTDGHAFDLSIFDKLYIKNTIIQSEQSVSTHALAGSLLHVPFSFEIVGPASSDGLRINVTATLDMYIDTVHLEQLQMRDMYVYMNSLEYPVPRLLKAELFGFLLYRDYARETVLPPSSTTPSSFLIRKSIRKNVDTDTGAEIKVNAQVKLKVPAKGRYELAVVNGNGPDISFNTAQDTIQQLTYGTTSVTVILSLGNMVIGLISIILAAWTLARDYRPKS